MPRIDVSTTFCFSDESLWVQLRNTCVAVLVCERSSSLCHQRFCQRAASTTVTCNGGVKCDMRRSVVRFAMSSTASVAPFASMRSTLPGSDGTAFNVSINSGSVVQQTHSPFSGVMSAFSALKRSASMLAFSKSFKITRTRTPALFSCGMSSVRNRVFPAPRKPARRTRGIMTEGSKGAEALSGQSTHGVTRAIFSR